MRTSRLQLACRVVLVASLLSATVLWTGATPAGACSCSQPVLGEMLAGHDGAFVGQAVSETEASYTFDVEQWLQGSQERSPIEIEKSDPEDSCGFSAGMYASVAVFFNDDGDGRFSSDICGTMAPELVRSALKPSTVDPAAGPGTLLIAEAPSPTHLWLLDDEGRIAAAASPPPELASGAELVFVEQCPGGDLIVEAWYSQPRLLLLRDLATMEITRTVEFDAPDQWHAIACLDSAGDSLAFAFESYGEGFTIVDPDSGLTIAVVEHGDSPFALLELSSERATGVYLSNSGMQTIDLRTGEITPVDELEELVRSQVEYDPFGVSNMSLDGTKFGAYFNELMNEDGEVKRGFVTFDLDSKDLWWESLWGPGTDSIAWLGNEEVWGSGDSHGGLLLNVVGGVVSVEERGFCTSTCNEIRNSQPDGADFFVTGIGSVARINRWSRDETLLAEIPVTRWAHVLPLDSPVAVTRQTTVKTALDGKLSEAEPPSEAEPKPADHGTSDEEQALAADDAAPEGRRWRLVGGGIALLLLVGVGATVAFRRRTS